MKSVQQLLAKSFDRRKYGETPPGFALLTQHTRDVVAACDSLANVVGRVALTNAGIDPAVFEEFRIALRANAWIQDLGKGNSQVQEMLSTDPQTSQLVRHETLSGILVWMEQRMRAWVSPLRDALTVAVWGAMGHHRKFDQQTNPRHVLPLTVHMTHRDMQDVLTAMGEDLGLGNPPKFERDLIVARTRQETCDLAARDLLDQLIEEFEDLCLGAQFKWNRFAVFV